MTRDEMLARLTPGQRELLDRLEGVSPAGAARYLAALFHDDRPRAVDFSVTPFPFRHRTLAEVDAGE